MLRRSMIFVLLIAGWSAAQSLKVTASVDRTSLAVNQQLALSIELSGEGANSINQISLPDVSSHLALLGSGGSSQNIQIINGKMSVQKTFSYFYQAVQEGTCTIPAISVNYKGQVSSSQPITIAINKGASAAPGAAPSSSLPPGDASDEELFIRAIVNKRQVYQNELVVVTFRIFTRVNVSAYALSKLPDTAGFWTENFALQGPPQKREEIINGRKYVVADIHRMAMFPTAPGKMQIGSLGVDCDVRVQNRRRSNDLFDNFFDDPFFGRSVRKTVLSKPVSIDVLPFPVAEKPDSFSGLSGDFSIQASVDKSEVTTNEAVTLKVTISGEGNIKTIPRPNVILPRDFEQYEPKVSENIQRSGDRISGSKTFEYLLVPRFPGEQRIRPITFSYFDLRSRRYQTKSTAELSIKVTRGSGDVSTVPSGLSKEEVRFIGQDIRFIKLNQPEWRKQGGGFYRSGLLTFLWILPLLGLSAAVGYRRHLDKLSGDVAYARSRRANRMAMKRLTKAAELLKPETQKEFYAEVSRALLGFAADKLNIPAAGIVSDELEAQLRRKGVQEETIRSYMQLLQVCDFQRFAPADGGRTQMEQFYQNAKDAIINLEKAI